ncbi:hypothetical protein ACLB2K_038512 [Fragaria x ananassa]
MDCRRFEELFAAYLKQLDSRAAAKENEKALQCQNVKPTIGEDFPLDEPTSEESEVEVAENMANHPISKISGVPQENEPEDRTKQSIFEAEIGSHTNDDGETQIRIKGDPGASFPMRGLYADTGQPHGGQGGARLPSLVNHHDPEHDQLKLCPITGRDRDAAPSHDKRNEAVIMD